jgi:hypothetical protein
MRPTDFCHLNEPACTRTSCVPGSLRDFHRVDTSQSLGLRAIDRGTECFTALMNASADRSQTRAAIVLPHLPRRLSTNVGSERGRYLPTAPATDRASDTSVASPYSAECRSAFASPSAWLHITAQRHRFPA